MLLRLWDILAVLVFAVSGGVAGRRKGMDLWGMFVLAVITGTGGGTLRSILIGDVPPPLLREPDYFLAASAGTLVARFAEHWWNRARRLVSIIDAAGLGIYVVIGILVSTSHGLEPWAALAMGVVTAVFGGVLRDIARAEVPLIFRREIYATAALAGGILFLGAERLGVPHAVSLPVTAAVTTAIRLWAIRYQINQTSE
jgi:uncharacterized membrane protein YeiH